MLISILREALHWFSATRCSGQIFWHLDAIGTRKARAECRAAHKAQSVGQFNCQIANEANNLLVLTKRQPRFRAGQQQLPRDADKMHEGGRVVSQKFKVLAGNANITLRVLSKRERINRFRKIFHAVAEITARRTKEGRGE